MSKEARVPWKFSASDIRKKEKDVIAHLGNPGSETAAMLHQCADMMELRERENTRPIMTASRALDVALVLEQHDTMRQYQMEIAATLKDYARLKGMVKDIVDKAVDALNKADTLINGYCPNPALEGDERRVDAVRKAFAYFRNLRLNIEVSERPKAEGYEGK